jgi:sulfotransferase family protein
MELLGGRDPDRMPALPNLVIIGAMKCGTTSLHHYLASHPEVEMSREKELKFFVEPPPGRRPRSLGWYGAQFHGGTSIRGEASPDYTRDPVCSGVPERMNALIPDARLIYVVRDPIERLISHWIHMYAVGRENRSLQVVLQDLDRNEYVLTSQYHRHIERFLRYYDPRQLLVISQEDLWYRRPDTLRQVFRFLGVSEDFDSPDFRAIKHPSSAKRRKSAAGYAVRRILRPALRHLPTRVRAKLEQILFYPFSQPIDRPQLSGEDIRRLREHFEPDLEKLRAFTGRGFREFNIGNR